jgi:hypothetical protein
MTGTVETQTGAAIVGRLANLPAWEAELILSLRFWMAGPEGQQQVWNSFSRCFGSIEGRRHLRLFEGLLGSLCGHARRPLVRHGLGCGCIGSDEAIFVNLVREAARGDIAEAALIASLMVPAGQAELIALRAAEVGQALQQMTRNLPLGVTQAGPLARRLH